MAVAGVHLQNKPILFSYKSLPRFSCRWLVLPDFSSLKSCCLWPGMETVLPFSHVLKKGSSLAIFTPFISNPHSVPKVLQEELRQAAAQNSPEFRDQEPSCGRLSQVIPVCRLCSVAGVHSRCEKQKTQCNFLLESLRFSTLCIPPTPLSGVQPCLLHGHFGSPQGGPAGEKKILFTTTGCQHNLLWRNAHPHPRHRGCAMASYKWGRWDSNWEDPLAEGCRQQHTRSRLQEPLAWCCLCENQGCRALAGSPCPPTPSVTESCPLGAPNPDCSLARLCLHIGSVCS